MLMWKSCGTTVEKRIPGNHDPLRQESELCSLSCCLKCRAGMGRMSLWKSSGAMRAEEASAGVLEAKAGLSILLKYDGWLVFVFLTEMPV